MSTPASACAPWLLGGCILSFLAGCGGPHASTDFEWVDGARTRSAGPALSVHWTRDLAPPFEGAYVPVERSAPAADPDRGRVFVASSFGQLLAFDERGAQLFERDLKSPVDAPPVVDPQGGDVYVSTLTGQLLKLDATDGELRWQRQVSGSIAQQPVLSRDAVYVVTEEELVVALSRADGSLLWRLRREPRPGFAIAGHAGLTLHGRTLLTAFGDGTVMALDASDGRALWQTDTSTDLDAGEATEGFVDVDTTPVVVGDTVYVASFSGGLYGLELDSGTVVHHDGELTGIVDIERGPDSLVLSSGDHGLLCVNLPSLSPRWRRQVERGAPSAARVAGNLVYVTESRGALVALALADGRERGRLETGHGISSAPVLVRGRGFVLSNGARLFAFLYRD